ncbi:hypothetical protein Zmor_014764 [Zophobas morio]|uniref:Uncharacterized protein n=1 Tax=Zophobas morio TaxID=2755281 RepID=A0AA38MGV0_9CUCU|nr:hypothetical protein Zmor_014764 [Zophobas morio]
MSDSRSECCTPPELCEAAKEAVNATLPAQSKERYQMVYDNFKIWCKRNKVQKSSENVLLVDSGFLSGYVTILVGTRCIAGTQ